MQVIDSACAVHPSPPSSPPSSQHTLATSLSLLTLPPHPLPPVCNHNNASLRHPGNKNQGLPSFYLPSLFPSLRTSLSARTKPIKGLALITASACRRHPGATPWGGGRAEKERAWARCGGRRGKRGEGETDAFPSLTPTPEPSRHYFIVLTEMKKEMMAAQGQAGKMWVA